MTRTRRFLGGLVFGYANQAVITLVGLWLTAFLIRRLGQQDYGLWLVALQIMGYLALLDLGVVALLPREIAFATGRAAGTAEVVEDLGDVVGRTLRLVLWQLPLVALTALMVWALLPTEWAALSRPLGIVMAVFVLAFPLRILRGVLTGLQELAVAAAVYTIAWAAGTAVMVGLVIAGWDLYALATGWSLTLLIAAALWFARIGRRYPRALPRRLPPFSPIQLKDRLARSGWVSISQVAQVLLYGTELLIIGKLLGPEAVVPYFCTAKVLTVLGRQSQLFAQTAAPGLSELRAGGTHADVARACGALVSATLLVSGLIVCVVIVVNEGFVVWWVGAERFAGMPLTYVLLAAMVLRHWNLTTLYSLFAFAQDRRLSLTTLGDGVVTVAATVILTARFGLMGAAVGTLAGVVLVSLPLNLAALAAEVGRPAKALVADLATWAWRFAVLVAAAVLVGHAWTPVTLFQLVVATLTVTVVYAALMIPVALRPPVGVYVIPRLRRLLELMGWRGSLAKPG